MATDHPCPLCGHSLVGQQIGSRCPECALLIVPGAAITRPRELFIIGIRLIGVWYLALTVNWLFAMVGSLRMPSLSANDTDLAQLISLLGNLVIGVYCLFGAPQLVGVTYGHTLARQTELPKAGTSGKSS